MKRLLIVYTKMIVGGSTTSLLSILNLLDYGTFQVDLLLHEHGGDLFDLIPAQVHVLPQGMHHPKGSVGLLARRLLRPSYVLSFIKSRWLSATRRNPLLRQQVMSYESAAMSRIPKEPYDIAVGFLEFWPTIVVSGHVHAKRKLAWLHIDYLAIRLLPGLDEACFRRLDRIVLVSEPCRVNFDKAFPALRDRSVYIANILHGASIRRMAAALACDLERAPDVVHLVSVCRIVFSHKGLDRGLRGLRTAVSHVPGVRVKWWIIGDGEDLPQLRNMIETYGMQAQVVCLGQRINPFPCVAGMDVFFLPSLYEGKPMAVTEAMMLHVPPLVTRYASAPEQIEDGVDGLIVENSEAGIAEGLTRILREPSLLARLKQNLAAREYSNEDEMERIHALFLGPDDETMT